MSSSTKPPEQTNTAQGRIGLSATASEFVPRQQRGANTAAVSAPRSGFSASAAAFVPAAGLSASAAAAPTPTSNDNADAPPQRRDQRGGRSRAPQTENDQVDLDTSRRQRNAPRFNHLNEEHTSASANDNRRRRGGGGASASAAAAADDPSDDRKNETSRGGRGPRGGGDGRDKKRVGGAEDDEEGTGGGASHRGDNGRSRRGGPRNDDHPNNPTRNRRGGGGPSNLLSEHVEAADTERSSRNSRSSKISSTENADSTPFISDDLAEGIVKNIGEGTAATRRICTELLTGEYECVLCLVPIRAKVATWSCGGCYHVFHLSCVKHWAKQPESGSGKTFRCPHCQAPDNVAAAYYCFCTKQRDPKYDPNLVPHSCGETCSKKRGQNCNHPCPSMCHPGPCPPCPRFHTASCPCGATQYDYGCDKLDPKITCGGVCGKPLPCGNHTCHKPCHNGPCGKCEETQEVPCVCGKETRSLPCGSRPFQCAQPCGKTQRCGHHQCPVTCHAGNCPPCDLDPSLVSTCPCGKQDLTTARTSCTDPVPTCGNLCGKALLCGNHVCEEPCHDGPCKPCTLKVLAKCRCGQVQAKVVCNEREAFRCEKKCKGGLKCGKHECPTLCCAFRGKLHPNNNECPRICGKQLICGHTCPDRCHPNLCQPCPNVITSVLQCRCGNQQLIPPLPCGTLPPRCYLPCTLPRACGHPQTKHDCHYDDCPPCMHLIKKRCDGGHKDVEVFCHTTQVCCGSKCGRPLPCGHACDRLCHDGPCQAESEVCKRLCGKELPDCGHFCSTPCHSSKPNVICKCATKVTIACECGLRSEEVTCAKYQKMLNARLERKEEAEAKREAEEEERKVAAAAAESKKSEEGGDAKPAEESASASAATTQPETKAASQGEEEDFDRPITIACTADCAYQNRLSALAARSAPKIEAKHKATIYSLHLWEVSGSALDVVGKIETKLNEFVRNPLEISLMMPPMPRDRRAIVHELANFYHLKCESLDNEPNRACYLTKTMTSRVPTPQLTAARINAVYHETCDPTIIIPKVITSPTLAPSQTLIFSADKGLNEISICQYLKEIIGSFVAVQSEEAYGMCPNIGPSKMHGPLFDAMSPNTYFAVFATKFDTDAGFAILRKHGCPVLYRRVGEAPPPAKHVWEPRRDPVTGDVIPGEGEFGSAAAPKPAKSWGEMFATPRLNAKQRRELENSKVETSGGAFAALRRK